MLLKDAVLRIGQARKSLWIETIFLDIEGEQGSLVRLVRACGSKLLLPSRITVAFRGQARKSLWIETVAHCTISARREGQARKSLWIETRH